jgi:hypothetical protein
MTLGWSDHQIVVRVCFNLRGEATAEGDADVHQLEAGVAERPDLRKRARINSAEYVIQAELVHPSRERLVQAPKDCGVGCPDSNYAPDLKMKQL